jgi:hypothetical protein
VNDRQNRNILKQAEDKELVMFQIEPSGRAQRLIWRKNREKMLARKMLSIV